MYNSIKSSEDIRYFLEKVNSLHDGYIIDVRYINNGISKMEHGYSFNPEKTKLVIKILVTSILDAVVELEFENLLEWQIKDNQWGLTDTTVMFDDKNWILWSDDACISMEEAKKGSYAIAKSMRWKIAERKLQSSNLTRKELL
ncbi:MAG: hypothetical protein IIX85_03175 [Clostridia bacterium]|nr:hypothetical protein [Clostridia bacterium]